MKVEVKSNSGGVMVTSSEGLASPWHKFDFQLSHLVSLFRMTMSDAYQRLLHRLCVTMEDEEHRFTVDFVPLENGLRFATVGKTRGVQLRSMLLLAWQV